MHVHTKKLIMRGQLLANTDWAMILVHGRGGTAENILELSQELKVKGFSLMAPQACKKCWYPDNFMAPVEDNEPDLSSGLHVLEEVVCDAFDAGLQAREIYFLGFSQGACLVAEYVARHARQYGGIFLLSGGLMGPAIRPENYKGKFYGTSVFIGCSDDDPHIPLERVKATTSLFEEMGANVRETIYPGMGHTIVQEEIEEINGILQERAR